MKKLAIGCGAMLLISGIVAGGVLFYLYRQVSSTVAQFAELAQVPELERSVTNRTPFVPPATEVLTDGQIEQLVQVQSEVRRRLGERMKTMQAKYKALAEKQEATLADAPALVAAYRDLAATWMDAKRGQVEALNKAGLSLEEYRWIRDQAYKSVGLAFVDLDVGKLVDEAKRGINSETVGRLRGALEPVGPEANRKRLERFKKFLEENVALASFGL